MTHKQLTLVLSEYVPTPALRYSGQSCLLCQLCQPSSPDSCHIYNGVLPHNLVFSQDRLPRQVCKHLHISKVPCLGNPLTLLQGDIQHLRQARFSWFGSYTGDRSYDFLTHPKHEQLHLPQRASTCRLGVSYMGGAFLLNTRRSDHLRSIVPPGSPYVCVLSGNS